MRVQEKLVQRQYQQHHTPRRWSSRQRAEMRRPLSAGGRETLLTEMAISGDGLRHRSSSKEQRVTYFSKFSREFLSNGRERPSDC